MSSPAVVDVGDEVGAAAAEEDEIGADQEDNDNTTTSPLRRNFFSSVQTRRWGAMPWMPCTRLCPSMDLLVLGLAVVSKNNLSSLSKGPHGVGGRPAMACASLGLYRTTATTTASGPGASASAKLTTLLAPPTPTSSSSTDMTTDAGLPENPASEPDRHPTAGAGSGWVQAAWRPDGRFLAVVDAPGVLSLFHVQDMISPSSSSSSAGATGGPPLESTSSSLSSLAPAVPGKVFATSLRTFSTWPSSPRPEVGPVTGLCWSHVGRRQPSWPTTSTERERLYGWYYQSAQLLDRERYILPGSEYHHSAGGVDPMEDRAGPLGRSGSGRHDAFFDSPSLDDPTRVLPQGQTPLSLLCITTQQHGLYLYLHGRYPLVKGRPLMAESFQQMPASEDDEVSMAVSADLSHLVVLHSYRGQNPHPVRDGTVQTTTTTTLMMSLYYLPKLAEHPYTWQCLTAWYCALSDHLAAMMQSRSEILSLWQSSLKPLDLKLDHLAQLLQNYGLLSPKPLEQSAGDGVESRPLAISHEVKGQRIRRILVQYMLSGRTEKHGHIGNALDQFFTGVAMNDQLLQRLERSMAVAVAHVETALRRQAQSPVTALVHEIDQLLGLARSLPDDASNMLPFEAVGQLLQDAENLFLAVERAWSELVQARFRLNDWVAWLRSTGSHIKARGTAPNSVQRDHAKNRRCSDATIQRMLQYLNDESNEEDRLIGSGAAHTGSRGLTESVLGIQFSVMLAARSEGADRKERPSSPPSVRQLSGMVEPNIPNLHQLLHETEKSFQNVFTYPRLFMTESIQPNHISIPISTTSSSQDERVGTAVTMRMGRGRRDDVRSRQSGSTPRQGYFDPDPRARHRQYVVVANVDRRNRESIRLRAFPLKWEAADADGDDTSLDMKGQASTGLASTLYWTVQLVLPEHHQVVDVAFYSDDGKSSLSSFVDSGTGVEGRQALGALVRCGHTLQLWMIPYDQLDFECLPLSLHGENDMARLPSDEPATFIKMQPTPRAHSGKSNDRSTIMVKTRTVCSNMDPSCSSWPGRLTLSGSRGMAAVFYSSQEMSGTCVMELLDLEEDEEEEGGDDDEEEEADDDGDQDMVDTIEMKLFKK